VPTVASSEPEVRPRHSSGSETHGHKMRRQNCRGKSFVARVNKKLYQFSRHHEPTLDSFCGEVMYERHRRLLARGDLVFLLYFNASATAFCVARDIGVIVSLGQKDLMLPQLLEEKRQLNQ
jgi:hypothetical protein